jgi:hypothetical protein
MASNYSRFSAKYHLNVYGFRTREEANYFLELLEPIIQTVIGDLKKTYTQKGKPVIDITGSMEINEKIER